LFTKSETLDSCRFETKTHQNAPNPISISIFSGDPRHWGLCPRPPGRGGRGRERREGREGKGEGKGGQGKGKEGWREGEGELCVIAVDGIDAPGSTHVLTDCNYPSPLDYFQSRKDTVVLHQKQYRPFLTPK